MSLAPMALAGGSGIFLGVILVFFIAVVWGFYTRTGSGIDQHAYGKIYGGAPGANSPSEISGRDSQANVRSWTRGTR
jgi:hypothetical protein